VSEFDLGIAFERWANNEPAIKALVLFGSRARASGSVDGANAGSDWDFQVITRQPSRFENAGWVSAAGISEPIAYALRPRRVGSGVKVSAVFAEGELELVSTPAIQFSLAKWLWRFGLLARNRRAMTALGDLASLLRPGYRVVKGEAGWGRFFAHVATSIPPTRLDDEAIVGIAARFVCDYLSAKQKIDRGELLAAQRWLHHYLAEANFNLLHELRERRDEKSYHVARRIEQVVGERWRRAVTVAALPEPDSLRAAVEVSAQTCRELVAALIGERWHWPKQISSSLRAE
jgi:hypothetical protein